MKVEQLTVNLGESPGRLTEVTNILAKNCINIRVLSMSDGSAPATLRMIVNDTGKAKQILQENGFNVGEIEVLVLEVPDKPGGLASALDAIKGSGVNLEYMYAFSQRGGESGLLIFRFDNQGTALEVFQKAGLHILSGEEVYSF